MNSLHDLLLKRDFDMPPEVAAIKQYVHSEFNADVSVQLREKDIIISGRSSALIGSLRLHLQQLQKAAKTDKKLVLRVG
ncbi:hypothetical protein KC976_00615 [Candidatus Saccharibacteria bacterium]|jgi:ribosomal protein L6P/L9E|nr:hypothetical protein [Candidatus Saccharibacteria bacterium]HPG37260.1 hypothetical protein [Candidatus Saccharibacteria bacterium]